MLTQLTSFLGLAPKLSSPDDTSEGATPMDDFAQIFAEHPDISQEDLALPDPPEVTPEPSEEVAAVFTDSEEAIPLGGDTDIVDDVELPETVLRGEVPVRHTAQDGLAAKLSLQDTLDVPREEVETKPPLAALQLADKPQNTTIQTGLATPQVSPIFVRTSQIADQIPEPKERAEPSPSREVLERTIGQSLPPQVALKQAPAKVTQGSVLAQDAALAPQMRQDKTRFVASVSPVTTSPSDTQVEVPTQNVPLIQDAPSKLPSQSKDVIGHAQNGDTMPVAPKPEEALRPVAPGIQARRVDTGSMARTAPKTPQSRHFPILDAQLSELAIKRVDAKNIAPPKAKTELAKPHQPISAPDVARASIPVPPDFDLASSVVKPAEPAKDVGSGQVTSVAPPNKLSTVLSKPIVDSDVVSQLTFDPAPTVRTAPITAEVQVIAAAKPPAELQISTVKTPVTLNSRNGFELPPETPEHVEKPVTGSDVPASTPPKLAQPTTVPKGEAVAVPPSRDQTLLFVKEAKDTDGDADPARSTDSIRYKAAAPILTPQATPLAIPQAQMARVSQVTSPFLADIVEDPIESETLLTTPTGEVRAAAGAAAPSAPSHSTRVDPGHVLRQMADAMPKLSDGGVELRLNPEELGRVHMQIIQNETGLTVHINADRPETLDLLRRHIDQLAKNLADAGFDSAGFSFGQSSDHDSPHSGSPSSPEPLQLEDMPTPQTLSVASDGLDIRI